jgi:hypothetical protein
MLIRDSLIGQVILHVWKSVSDGIKILKLQPCYTTVADLESPSKVSFFCKWCLHWMLDSTLLMCCRAEQGHAGHHPAASATDPPVPSAQATEHTRQNKGRK